MLREFMNIIFKIKFVAAKDETNSYTNQFKVYIYKIYKRIGK